MFAAAPTTATTSGVRGVLQTAEHPGGRHHDEHRRDAGQRYPQIGQGVRRGAGRRAERVDEGLRDDQSGERDRDAQTRQPATCRPHRAAIAARWSPAPTRRATPGGGAVGKEDAQRNGRREQRAGDAEPGELRCAQVPDDGRVGEQEQWLGDECAERGDSQPDDLAVVWVSQHRQARRWHDQSVASACTDPQLSFLHRRWTTLSHARPLSTGESGRNSHRRPQAVAQPARSRSTGPSPGLSTGRVESAVPDPYGRRAVGEELSDPTVPTGPRRPTDQTGERVGRSVSVAEFPSTPSHAQFERTPPQDVAAEQSVLGGMLLSKDAIADVVEVVRGHDFYRPAHELVYETVLDLYGRGEPADAVTVSAELQKRGELARVGGAPYLHTLISSVPTAANAGYYARIVRETAVLRRLIEAGTKIVQMGFAGDGDADDVVDAAQAEVYAVTDRRTSEDYLPLSAIMEGTLDEIEAIGSRGGEMVGVPTGFVDFDELTNGLHPGPDDRRRGPAGRGQGTGPRHSAAHPPRLDDDGRGRRRRPAARRRWPPDHRGRRDDGDVRPPVLRARLLRRLDDRRRRRARVADRHRGGHGPRSRPPSRSRERCARVAPPSTGVTSTGSPTRPRSVLPEAELPLVPYALGAWLGEAKPTSARFTSRDPEIAMYLDIDGPDDDADWLLLRPGSHRRQADSGQLPARLRAAAARPAGRPARHRRHGDSGRLGAVRRPVTAAGHGHP